ncbi:MAG: hypothetical protein ACOYOL_07165 [Chthoniobacterales bacterium]
MIPASSHYAGVGNLAQVAMIDLGTEDHDDSRDVERVIIQFNVTTFVYQ